MVFPRAATPEMFVPARAAAPIGVQVVLTIGRPQEPRACAASSAADIAEPADPCHQRLIAGVSRVEFQGANG